MWAPGIIVADPPSQSGTQFRSGLECVQIDALILQAAPEPLDEYVVHPAPTAVHRDACACFLQHTGEAREVNWLAWSVLKISGQPNRAKASSRASMQNSLSMVFDTRQESDSSP